MKTYIQEMQYILVQEVVAKVEEKEKFLIQLDKEWDPRLVEKES